VNPPARPFERPKVRIAPAGFGLGILLALTLASSGAAQRPGPPGPAFTQGAAPETIDDVVIHPIVSADFSCGEHAFHPSDPVILGDAVGADCTVLRYDLVPRSRRPPQYFDHDGQSNEDWYGWGKELLAPFDGTIDEIHINPVTNVPGTPGQGPASFIVFLRSDGVRVVYGHVQDVKVKQGDTVRAGQPVAVIGNNGFGYMPHTHLGAWKGATPLQIRFDLKAIGRLQEARLKAENSKTN